MQNHYDKTKRQVKYWQYAAWTLPFIALAIIVATYFIGWDTGFAVSITSVVLIFFAVGVFWWWWTLDKIILIFKSFEETARSLGLIQKNIVETKNELQKSHSDRERREQD